MWQGEGGSVWECTCKKRYLSPAPAPKRARLQAVPALQIRNDDLDSPLFSIVYSFSLARRMQVLSQ